MEDAHCAHHAVLSLRCTRDVKLGKEVICYGDQRVFGPAGEPVHGTAADQSRELQGAVTELFAHLAKGRKLLIYIAAVFSYPSYQKRQSD